MSKASYLPPTCCCYGYLCILHLHGVKGGGSCPVNGKVTVGLAPHWPRVRLWRLVHLRAHGPREGDEHPTYMYAPRGVWCTFPFTALFDARLKGGVRRFRLNHRLVTVMKTKQAASRDQELGTSTAKPEVGVSLLLFVSTSAY